MTVQPGFLLITLVGFATFFSRTGGLFNVIPVLGQERLSLTADQIGLGLASISVMAILLAYPAGALADRARKKGLLVRGVMGYEGHAMPIEEREKRRAVVAQSMALLQKAHADVGGELISAGGTGSFDLNTWASEIQAGSYALMDTAYAKLGLPFRQALSLLSTVLSVNEGFAVADCGLKALGMDHGNPTVEGGRVWFCSDEHLTFAPEARLHVGQRVRVLPAHVDPTVAYHERIYVVSGEEVLDVWPVDLRGW